MEIIRERYLRPSTNQTEFQNILTIKISPRSKGISYLLLSVDTPANILNARYRIKIGDALDERDMQFDGIYQVEFPHLTKGVYGNIKPNSDIIIQHRSTDGAVTIQSAISLTFSEVFEEYEED